ncbi:hypothetical protein DFH08DRAFT_696608, partial [Mycena albidolilacea]
ALVEKSSGYFIYASTVIKRIEDKRFHPADRLDIVLGIKSSISGSPFDIVDQLYHQTLCAVPIEYRPKLTDILAVIGTDLVLRVSKIEVLLRLDTGDVQLTLRGLHSVIGFYPEWNHTVVHDVHHGSFLDFLCDIRWSGPLYIGSSQCHRKLTSHFL